MRGPSSTPRPLPEPGFGIAVLNEREGLGDGFSKLFLLRALKRAYPREKITWVVSESDSPYRVVMAEIARPYVDRVIVDAGIRGPSRSAFRSIRKLGRFSLVIDHRTDSLVIGMTKLAIRTKVYQAASPGFLFCSRRPRGGRPKHKLTQLMMLLEAVIGSPPDGSGEIELPEAILQTAAALLPAGPRYVGLAPGASSRTRCWPIDHFVGLARWIQERGWTPVLLLGPDEQDLRAALREALPQALFPASSNGETLTDVRLSLAIGKRLNAAVAMDTGIGHLLAATGTPLVSLFGPSNPERWKAVGGPVRIVSAKAFGGPEIARIPVSAVSSALDEILG